MDILSAFAFIPGDPSQSIKPLGRYLPEIPAGLVHTYLIETGIKRNSLILDPFGTSVQMILEMAAAGYQVLTAVNNPITRFVLEVAADPPSQPDLLSALSELASSRKGNERLESHLLSLYMTTCPHCNLPTPAEAFIWDRGEKLPSRRKLHCKNCGEYGDYATLPEDHEKIIWLNRTAGLHKSRALERVTASGDPDRAFVEEALAFHTPRALYSLMTIINRLEGLQITERQRRDLTALVLGILDEANTLWPVPYDRPRPRKLVIPPRYQEVNIWLALENSLNLWTDGGNQIPVGTWPNLPINGSGICIFEGPVRDLSNQITDIPIQAVITSYPRHNQAFWSLSALWAGFLWGHEAVAPFKYVLRRQRYDWNWHADALESAFNSLYPHLSINTPFLSLLAEPEPSFVTAAFKAAAASGFSLQAIALRSIQDPIQIHLQRQVFNLQTIDPVDIQQLKRVILDFMEKRGEPVTYLHLHTAFLAYLSDSHTFNWQAELISDLHKPIQVILEHDDFTRFGETSSNLEAGLWGLCAHSEDMTPLPDQVEKFLVNYLSQHSEVSRSELDFQINRNFPGLYTPQLAITRNILSSYAVQKTSGWMLREEDQPSSRRKDLESIRELLIKIGKELNYQVSISESEFEPILWKEDGKVIFCYYVIASAVIGRIFMQAPKSGGTPCLVLPGGRAGLISYKLDRDPVLKELSIAWQLLKYRQIRQISEQVSLSREDWLLQLGADPVTHPEQMRLF